MDLKTHLALKKNSFLTDLLKGIGQIMLQENFISGLLILIGIFCGSFLMGIAALVGSSCGTITAWLLHYNKSNIHKGLYGFSAALVGAAVISFLKPSLLVWMFIIVGSILATAIQHFFINRNFNAFTLPFVLVCWVILFLSKQFYAEAFIYADAVVNVNSYGFILKSFGQVIFQDNLFSGALFLIAVLINSFKAAVFGIFGAIISSCLAFLFSNPTIDISNGLYGFNAVLCAIAFAGNHLKDVLWAFISCTLSVIIICVQSRLNIVPLTFPFVLASIITYYLKIKFKSKIS